MSDKINMNAVDPKNFKSGDLVDTFTIPEDMAKRLSDLLVQQSIRQNLLAEVVMDSEKYAKVESMLIPIMTEVDTIKNEVGRLVPREYQSSTYKWNYNGWAIDNNVVQILKA